MFEIKLHYKCFDSFTSILFSYTNDLKNDRGTSLYFTSGGRITDFVPWSCSVNTLRVSVRGYYTTHWTSWFNIFCLDLNWSCTVHMSITMCFGKLTHHLRRNPPEVRVTGGQKPSTKNIYIVSQTSARLGYVSYTTRILGDPWAVSPDDAIFLGERYFRVKTFAR